MTIIAERVERYAPLIDISVRSGGDGRTVDAYAAVFDTPQEIRDREGHYIEQLHRSTFDKTLAQRGNQLQAIFNHGKTMYGTPSERFSMPIGVPLEVKPEPKGLWTATRMAKTPLGDEVLQLIDEGAIKGYSFSGSFLATDRQRAKAAGGLPTFVRMETALREYGPTPFPYYADAQIVGVRSEAAELLATMTAEEIDEFVASLAEPARADLLRALAATDTGTGNDSHTATGDAVVSRRSKSHLAMERTLLTMEES